VGEGGEIKSISLVEGDETIHGRVLRMGEIGGLFRVGSVRGGGGGGLYNGA